MLVAYSGRNGSKEAVHVDWEASSQTGRSMREMTVRIRFVKPSLGNQKRGDQFIFSRTPDGRAVFLASWHKANLRFAASLLNIHQDEVDKIYWDIAVDGAVRADPWFRRYYKGQNGKTRFAVHEAFFAGQVIGIHCVVPARISDDDFWRLMQIAGQYRGLSPWKPREWGFFEVVGLRPRRCREEEDDDEALEPKEEQGRHA